MLILLFATLAKLSSELESFLDTDVRLFFSSANHVQLVKNQETGTFSYRSKFSDAGNKKYKSVFKVSKSGMKYSIRLDGEYLCDADKKELKTSLSQCLWKITPKKLGFVIANDDECITATADSILRLEKCTGTEDQLFDFEAFQDCKKDEGGTGLESDAKKEHQLILKIDQQEALKLPIFDVKNALKPQSAIVQTTLAANPKSVAVVTKTSDPVIATASADIKNTTVRQYIIPTVTTTTIIQIIKDGRFSTLGDSDSTNHDLYHRYIHNDDVGDIKFI